MKKRFYITILMMITILAGIYGIASQYREPLDFTPTDVSDRTKAQNEALEKLPIWICEGPACEKL